MAKRSARQRAIQRLDREFSRYIRGKYTDHTGRVECFTCGANHNPWDVHCGHFQSRRYMATRWSEDNRRPQCVSCNIYHQGRQYEFGNRLDRESPGLAAEVIVRSREVKKWTLKQIEALIQHYRNENDASGIW